MESFQENSIWNGLPFLMAVRWTCLSLEVERLSNSRRSSTSPLRWLISWTSFLGKTLPWKAVHFVEDVKRLMRSFFHIERDERGFCFLVVWFLRRRRRLKLEIHLACQPDQLTISPIDCNWQMEDKEIRSVRNTWSFGRGEKKDASAPLSLMRI